jgi:CubicO group peptidase (beta-lactamase class C family)
VASSYEAVLRAALDQELAGIAVQVTRRGDLLYEAALGLASRQSETPLALPDQFRIYSITKAFTALLILQLVDAGVLTLNEPITTWLHDPAADRIPAINQMTPRQLLTHASGTCDSFLLRGFLRYGSGHQRGLCGGGPGRRGRRASGVPQVPYPRLAGRLRSSLSCCPLQ